MLASDRGVDRYVALLGNVGTLYAFRIVVVAFALDPPQV